MWNDAHLASYSLKRTRRMMCISAGWTSPRSPFKARCARDMAIAPESNGPDANNSLQDVHHRSVEECYSTHDTVSQRTCCRLQSALICATRVSWLSKTAMKTNWPRDVHHQQALCSMLRPCAACCWSVAASQILCRSLRTSIHLRF